MKSLSELYDPTPTEISGQDTLFIQWFNEYYTSPDEIFVIENKIFVSRIGSSAHIFGRTGGESWEHMEEYHFDTERDATSWFNKIPRSFPEL